MNKTLRIIVGLLMSALSLWFVFRGFDFGVLRQTLRQASYAWFVPAAFFFASNMTLRAFRWRIILSPLKELPISVVMPKLLIGFFMNNILPARGGEVVRAVALSRAAGVPTSSILGSIVAERLSDMMGLLAIMIAASRLLPWEKLPFFPVVGTIAAGTAVVGGFVYWARKTSSHGIFYRLTSGFLAIRSPVKVGAVLSLSLLVWIGELLIVFFTSRALLLNLTFFESAGLITGLSVGVMIPAAPGYVGTYEFFGKSVLTLLGKPEAVSLSFVLVLHFFQLILVALAALPWLILPNPVPHET